MTKINVRYSIHLGRKIASTDSVEMFDCGAGDHLHLIGYDADDQPFCEFIITEKTLNQMHDMLGHPDKGPLQ